MSCSGLRAARMSVAIAILAICLSVAALAQAPTGENRAIEPDSVAASGDSADPGPWEAFTLRWLEAVGWMVAISAAAYGIGKGRQELVANRLQRAEALEQRVEDLKWRRAQAAKALNDEMMADPRAHDALLMIDYPSGRPYELAKDCVETVTGSQVLTSLALRPKPGETLSGVDRFVRDAFDELLYRIGILEHYIDRDLVREADVIHPIDYYVRRMKDVGLWDAVQAYIEDYHFYRTKAFLQRPPLRALVADLPHPDESGTAL
jgi:hypothetical protein